MNIEDNIQQLEDLVAKMDDKEITLDNSLELFNQGIKLSQSCLQQLATSKGKLELLNQDLTRINLDVEVEAD